MALNLSDENLERLERATPEQRKSAFARMSAEEKSQLAEAMMARQGSRTPGSDSVKVASLRPEDVGVADSALQGFGEGATFGHSSELGGAIQAGLGWAAQALPRSESFLGFDTRHLDELGDTYGSAKKENDAILSVHQQENPSAFLAGEVGGQIASSAALGAGLGNVAAPLAKGFTGAAASGALSGALTGLGKSDADLTEGEIGKYLWDGAKGGFEGAAWGAAGYGLGNVAGKVALKAKDGAAKYAAERALKATGISGKNLRKLPEAMRENTGRVIADNMMKFGSSAGEIAEKAEEVLGFSGKLVGDTLSRADEAAAAAGQGAFDWVPVMHRINELKSSLRATGKRLASNSIASETGGYGASFFDDIASEASQGGGYSVANVLKTEIGDGLKFSDESIKQKVARQLYGILNEEIEDQLGTRLGGQVAEEFRAAKRLYGAAKFAATGGKDAADQLGNRALSLTDFMTGLTAAAKESDALPATLKGAAFAFANKLVRERGSSAVSVVAKEFGQSKAIRDAILKTPAAFGKFLPALKNAAKTDEGLAAADYVLSQQNEDYRKRKRIILEQSKP